MPPPRMFHDCPKRDKPKEASSSNRTMRRIEPILLVATLLMTWAVTDGYISWRFCDEASARQNLANAMSASGFRLFDPPSISSGIFPYVENYVKYRAPKYPRFFYKSLIQKSARSLNASSAALLKGYEQEIKARLTPWQLRQADKAMFESVKTHLVPAILRAKGAILNYSCWPKSHVNCLIDREMASFFNSTISQAIVVDFEKRVSAKVFRTWHNATLAFAPFLTVLV